MPKEDKFFNGLDDVIQIRIGSVLFLRGKQLPPELIERHFVHVKLKKDEKVLGLSIRNGMITKISYDSPLKGALLIGDVILYMNGHLVSFCDACKEEEKSHLEKLKKTTEDFNSLMHSLIEKGTTKYDIGFVRLKSRLTKPTIPGNVQICDGHIAEIAVLYQYKFLKLGLHVQDSQGQIIVHYTIPETSSHLCLNTGETMVTIDEQPISSLKCVKSLILDSCYKKAYAKILIHYPSTDMLKNGVRNRLMIAEKEHERPLYIIGLDVRKYSEEGIETLKNCREPDPIWFEPGSRPKKAGDEKTETSNEKKVEKSGGAKSLVRKIMFFRREKSSNTGVSFNDTADEHDIPSEWNSKLFVVLPPLKTFETEKSSGGATPSIDKNNNNRK